MCGRFSLKAAPDELERAFGVAVPPGHRPRYNIAPMQALLAVLREDGAEPQPRMLQWGLVPFWAEDPGIGSRMINARAETIAGKPAFRAAFARRRCLVLADGFFEWQRRPDGKRPMWIRQASGEPFAFAAVWERWGRGARPLETCSLLTTAADDFMRPIHDRMPVILGPDEQSEWTSPAASRTSLLDLLAGYRAPALVAHEVSTLVNSPAHDVPACLDPVA